jgi:hypothetical protein
MKGFHELWSTMSQGAILTIHAKKKILDSALLSTNKEGSLLWGLFPLPSMELVHTAYQNGDTEFLSDTML